MDTGKTSTLCFLIAKPLLSDNVFVVEYLLQVDFPSVVLIDLGCVAFNKGAEENMLVSGFVTS